MTYLPPSIAGANSIVYSISKVQASNAAGYSVVITNSLGSITSRVATLTVSPPCCQLHERSL